MSSTTLILVLIIFVGIPLSCLGILLVMADHAPEEPEWMQRLDEELKARGQ